MDILILASGQEIGRSDSVAVQLEGRMKIFEFCQQLLSNQLSVIISVITAVIVTSLSIHSSF